MSSTYDAIDTWRRRHVKNEQDSGRQYLSGRIKCNHLRELDLVVPPAVLQVNSHPAVTSGHVTYNTLLMNKVRMRPDLSNLKSTVNGVTRHDIRQLPPNWLENWYFYIRINIDSKKLKQHLRAAAYLEIQIIRLILILQTTMHHV